jgi:hypothetical protein
MSEQHQRNNWPQAISPKVPEEMLLSPPRSYGSRSTPTIWSQ